MEVNGNELFEALLKFKDELKDEIVDLKITSKEDKNELKLEIGIVKNSQEKTHSDVIQLKFDMSEVKKDINNIKNENAEYKGEKRKTNYFMDKLFWPVCVTFIFGVTVNPIVTKLITPPQIQVIQVPVQHMTPTPTQSK